MINIVSLVENRSECGCRTAHGLSLFIETPRHKILFDVGKDDTFVENAERLGIEIESVDIVIISHGHYDHGWLYLSLWREIERQRYMFNEGPLRHTLAIVRQGLAILASTQH